MSKLHLLSISFLCGVFYRIGSLICLLLLPLGLLAQQFSVSPTQIEVSENENFTIEYHLEGSGMSDFQAPDLNDFLVVGGPNRSQNMQIINGSVRSSMGVSFVLRPKSAGTFTIMPATVITDKKKTLRSEKINITVQKGNKPSNSNANTNTPTAPSARGGISAGANAVPIRQLSEADIKGNLFLRVETDTTHYYQGEQATVVYRLYTALDVTDYTLASTPSFTGFWVQDMTPQRLPAGQTVVVGNQYFHTFDLRTYALFPQHSGELAMDTMEVEIAVREMLANPSRSIFGPQYETYKVKVKNGVKKITVLPLPQEGKPDDFNGAVGKFSLIATADKRNVQVNQSVKISVTLSGEGNIKLLEPPKWQTSDQFEQFDPIISEELFEQNNRINGHKKFEYNIVPQQAGTVQLPPITYSFFNPRTRKYERLSTTLDPLYITPADGSQTAAPTDIFPLKPDGTLSIWQQWQPQQWAWYPVLLLFPFVLLPAYAYREQRRRQQQHTPEAAFNRQKKQILQKIEDLRQLSASPNTKGQTVYVELANLLWSYLATNTHLPTTERTPQQLGQHLLKYGLPNDQIEQWQQLLHTCQTAVYAPKKSDSNHAQLLQQAKILVEKMPRLPH